MNRNRIRKESSAHGFALLFVLFLMALVLIGASVAVLRIKTEGRRAKEAEMIWRGEQYERAVGLFYRKNGRFPTSLDDLVKGTPGLRFLREPYKDPMNRTDGSWRLIYVAPTGQLIGSVRYITLQEMALADRARIMGLQMGQGGGADNSQGNGSSTPPGASDQSPVQNQNQSQNQSPAPPGAQPSTGSQSSQQATSPQPAPFGVMQQSQPLPPGAQPQNDESTGEVIGGFIVGVASKIDKPSLKVYKGGTTYKQWEFIYNPLEQVQTFGGGTVIGGTPAGPQPPTPPQPQPPQIPQPPQQQNP